MKNKLTEFVTRMEMLVMLTVLIMLCAYVPAAFASDFALINLSSPVYTAGAFIAADGSGSSTGGSVAIVPHKALSSDNILAAVVEGWQPLMVGGTLGGSLGKASVSAGPGVNLLPTSRATLLALVNAVTGAEQATGLKDALSSSHVSSDVTMFIGPMWGPVFKSFNKCHTTVLLHVAGSVKF